MLATTPLAVSLAVTVSAHCGRTSLNDATARYVAAQNQGSTAQMMTDLSNTVSYTENENPLDINNGVLSKALKIDHSMTIIDHEGCATFTELIVTDPKTPYVIGTRMLFDDHGFTVSHIDSIVTKPGDWAFNATGYLYWSKKEKWDPIPDGKQDTEAVIKAAGDAYFDRFANANITVPFGTTCARLEGGGYTGSANTTTDTCGSDFPTNNVISNRRYVVDDTMGVVTIFVGFPGLDATVPTKAIPDAHTFRVEGGKIKYIHTMSACVAYGCGQNGTTRPSKREFQRVKPAYLNPHH